MKLRRSANEIRDRLFFELVRFKFVHHVSPKRSPDKSVQEAMDRNAFRLCLNADDHDRLLHTDIWPVAMCISDLFFRDKLNSITRTKVNENALKIEVSKRQCVGYSRGLVELLSIVVHRLFVSVL